MTILPSGDVLIVADFSDISVGGERILLVRARDGETKLVDHMEAELLKVLRRPCAFDEIPARLKALYWEAIDRNWIKETLETFAAEGWLGTLGTLIQMAVNTVDTKEKGSGSTDGDTELPILSWPTRNRPVALARGLEAWRKVIEAADGPFPDAMIADDSTADKAATRSVVEGFAKNWKGTTYLLDAGFRDRLIKELSSIDAEAARFALDPEPLRNRDVLRYGANRNLIFLACAGKKVVMSDDDVLPEFRVRHDATDGLALRPGDDPTLFRAFESEADLAGYGMESSAYSPSMYNRLLGKSSMELLRDTGMADFSNTDSVAFERLLDPASRIASLCYGIWGDSGAKTSRYLVTTRDRLDMECLESSEYAKLADSRILFRAPSRLSIGGAYFQGVHVAFDLAQLLPPVAPLGRSEDNLWAACLARLRPDLLIANPLEAAHHSPLEQRSTQRSDTHHMIIGCNEVLAAILPRPDASGSPAELFRAVGATLGSVAGAPLPKFRRWVTERYIQHLSLFMSRMESLLSMYGGESDNWDEDMAAAIEELDGVAERPLCWLPMEFTNDEEGFRLYLQRFGRLLETWPELTKKAAQVAPALLEDTKLLSD